MVNDIEAMFPKLRGSGYRITSLKQGRSMARSC